MKSEAEIRKDRRVESLQCVCVCVCVCVCLGWRQLHPPKKNKECFDAKVNTRRNQLIAFIIKIYTLIKTSFYAKGIKISFGLKFYISVNSIKIQSIQKRIKINKRIKSLKNVVDIYRLVWFLSLMAYQPSWVI